ncbi:hypothetical protein ACPXCP_20320 [Streptomyces sp. DT20]|uniref:hypothetical protein n=1 Tax=Streptomyces sp. DT20 TaxID=3416519 RepID=UPI003CEE1448
MKTYAIRAARTKITGHLRQDGTRTTYCNKPVGIPNGDFQGLKGWKMCTRCVKGEARDRAEATVSATAALAPETAGTLPAMVCIQHGVDCTGDPKRRHNFRPATPEQPKPATCGARRPGWTTGPATGINRIPCTLDTDHTGDHRNAFGQTWPDYAAEKTAAQAAIAQQNTPITPHPIETYYTLYCTTHGSYAPCDSQQRHDYMHCTLNAEERASIDAGTVPPWCHSTADEDALDARNRPTAADRAAADEESRQTAALITEAEATAGTWRGEWIGARDTGPTLFALPAADQGALFA